MSTLRTTNIQHASAASANIVLDSSNNVTTANNLTAGGTLACTGNLTVTSGNVILSNGNGIDFSAAGNAAGMTSELFSDYEEGTWTPSIGGDATYTAQNGKYVKVGNIVTASFNLRISSKGTGSNNVISGLPFSTTSTVGFGGGPFYVSSAATSFISCFLRAGESGSSITVDTRSTAVTNLDSPPTFFQNSSIIMGSITYTV